MVSAQTYASCLSSFFSFLSSIRALFLKQTHTYTLLWSDWCFKLAWACRWSGCDYCLALRQLWWWHSALWAPLAWACSKHNQAVHTLPRNHPYMWPGYDCNTHTAQNLMIESTLRIFRFENANPTLDEPRFLCLHQQSCLLFTTFRAHVWEQPALKFAPKISSIILCCHRLNLYFICSKCLFAFFQCQAQRAAVCWIVAIKTESTYVHTHTHTILPVVGLHARIV